MSITSSFGLLCLMMMAHSGFTEPILYTITIRTANVESAGTDARVFINLTGRRGSTGNLALSDPDGSRFEIGSTDSFTVTAENVGRLTSITIGHDNSGRKPGWFLNDVRIFQNVAVARNYFERPGFTTYQFNWNNWIARDELDGTIVKTIPVERWEKCINQPGEHSAK